MTNFAQHPRRAFPRVNDRSHRSPSGTIVWKTSRHHHLSRRRLEARRSTPAVKRRASQAGLSTEADYNTTVLVC